MFICRELSGLHLAYYRVNPQQISTYIQTIFFFLTKLVRNIQRVGIVLATFDELY